MENKSAVYELFSFDPTTAKFTCSLNDSKNPERSCGAKFTRSKAKLDRDAVQNKRNRNQNQISSGPTLFPGEDKSEIFFINF